MRAKSIKILRQRRNRCKGRRISLGSVLTLLAVTWLLATPEERSAAAHPNCRVVFHTEVCWPDARGRVCVLPAKLKGNKVIARRGVCVCPCNGHIYREEITSLCRQRSCIPSPWLTDSCSFVTGRGEKCVPVPACGAGGVDDGTRMLSMLRSHQQLWGALLSWFFFFFIGGGGGVGAQGRGGGVCNLTQWGSRAEGE